MTTQTEMFPKTTMEVLESLRAFHVADVEKAGTALDNLGDDEKVARRYEKAEERLAAARDLVRDIDRAIHELQGVRPTVEEVAADIVAMADAGDFDAAGLVVSAVRGAGDPITGEVAPAVVLAFYPGDDEPHETQVGDRTRYGELVHDYFTAAGLNGKGEPTDWTVLAEDELTAETGGKRSLYDLIRSVDYGKRLLVVAADQGSVTGVDAEESAT